MRDARERVGGAAAGRRHRMPDAQARLPMLISADGLRARTLEETTTVYRLTGRLASFHQLSRQREIFHWLASSAAEISGNIFKQQSCTREK